MQILIIMRKKLLLILLTGSIAGCTSDLTGLNDDIKNPAIVPPATLFTNATRELMDAHASPNVFVNVFRVITQYWQQTTYNEESQYKLEGNSLSGAWWRDHYHYVLQNLKGCKEMVRAADLDEKVRKNQIAIIDVLEVVSYYYLTTTFGNVPYSQALNGENPFPAYDDANTIYTDLLRRISEDVANLDASAAGFGSADLFYRGNVGRWKKFAASFQLKMAMLIADSDVNKARPAAEAAITAGVFTSAADDCVLHYLSAPPYTNPLWNDLVESGRVDFVAAAPFVDSLKAYADPRLQRYFLETENGEYLGARPGTKPDFEQFSNITETLLEPTMPAYLLEYSEVKLLLAEAAQRGWNTGATAAEHYAEGVSAALASWGVTDAEIADYLANPKVAYNPANWKKSIGMQKWFAFFNRGNDGWTDYRRLDFPVLELPVGAVSGIPMRYRYPVSEHNINRRNYESAAQAVGGDKVETKLWWDKH